MPMTNHHSNVGVPHAPGDGLEAVVLAAGRGSRLFSVETLPKPVYAVEGRPLLARVVDGLQAAGVSTVHVVTGYGAEAVRACPGVAREGLRINWIDNPRYDEPNGLSLLCARGSVSPRFLVSMSDHLFQHDAIARFAAGAPAGGEYLAVDYDLANIFDMDDATKVRTGSDGAIEAIGKELTPFDAVDTGLFLLTPRVFDALEESVGAGDASLSGGIRRLAALGLMRAWDIGGGKWLDVDTPAASAEAARLVRAGRISG